MPDRQRVRAFLSAPRTERAILVLIVLNGITIGLETSTFLVDRIGGLLHLVDQAVLIVFVVEIAARVYSHRGAFFKDPWNWFDAIIVGIALIPASGPASVLRALRILRALRLVSAVPNMRRVVAALLSAIPGMASIIGLLLLTMYVSAVLATVQFGPTSPEYFEDLPTSLFTLFQIMTGESWPEIVQQVMTQHPWAWLFFVVYILASSFVVLNLFIAVVVNAMDAQTVSAEERETDERLTALMQELARLHVKIDSLQRPQEHGAPAQTT